MLSHESITHFISDVLHEQSLAIHFDRLRKIRNGINYYGESVEPETVMEALQEIPKIKKTIVSPTPFGVM
ncbi:MAG: hypothetical protein AABX16_00695 [Nanoarchaeota archaeon]